MEYVLRLVGYIIIIAFNGLMYFFLHSHFYFTVLCLLVIAPFCSAALNLWLKQRIEVSILAASSGDDYVRVGQEAFFYVEVRNSTFAPSLDAKLRLRISNDFLGTETVETMAVPVRVKGVYRVELPLRATLPGIVSVSAVSVKIKDLVGFVPLTKQLEKKASVTVLPQDGFKLNYDRNVIESGMLESEESTKRGNDFSDVQEIREYIPGDKLMSIHWKLSAKRDILMVKDRVSMSDRQIVILPELIQDTTGLDMILTAAYTAVKTLCEEHTTVRFFYWSMGRFDYEDVRIDYVEELKSAFAKMYYEKLYANPEEAASHMREVHPEIKAYMHISYDGSDAVITLKDNG